MKNIINKIRQVYSVSDEALQALQADMQVRYYPKNTYIVHSGVTDRLVYFIEEGVARSVFHHNGQDTTTWFSQEGDITFGMDSLYYKQPSVESIEALSDCKIYVIHIDKPGEVEVCGCFSGYFHLYTQPGACPKISIRQSFLLLSKKTSDGKLYLCHLKILT